LNEVEVKRNTKATKPARHVYKHSWSRLSGIVRYTVLLGALLATLPYAISGARIGWALCWRAVVAAGLVICVVGENPGFFTDGAGGLLEIPEHFAGLLNVALISILVEAVFGLLERHTVVRWGMNIKRRPGLLASRPARNVPGRIPVTCSRSSVLP
jgi:NitT/TauT family transport system permease protein